MLHPAYWVVIPTNTMVTSHNKAVMGAGLARQARDRFPGLDEHYGAMLLAGQRFVEVTEHRLLLVPTKTDWRQPSTIELVEAAVADLLNWHHKATHSDLVAVPKLGCGHGGLTWTDVHQTLQKLPSSRFKILV